MKNLILISFLIALSFQAKAQNNEYIPMLGDSIIWYFSGEPWGGTYSFSPEKDTLINSKLYKKINEEMWYGNVTAFIREDSILQKIFILSKDSTEERTLYDFSLNQGDSTFLEFIHTDYNLRTGWYTVDTIMVYSFNNIDRKLLYLTCPNNPYLPEFLDYPRLYWVEGVGSLIHPIYLDHLNWHVGIHPLCPQHIYEMALICTYLNEEHIYMHPCWEMAGGDCDSGIGIQEKENIPQKGVYPNPVIDISKLDLSQFSDEVKYIQIYNSLGILVKEIAINNKAEITIRKSDYKSGLHFLRIVTINNRIHSFKFIIN